MTENVTGTFLNFTKTWSIFLRHTCFTCWSCEKLLKLSPTCLQLEKSSYLYQANFPSVCIMRLLKIVSISFCSSLQPKHLTWSQKNKNKLVSTLIFFIFVIISWIWRQGSALVSTISSFLPNEIYISRKIFMPVEHSQGFQHRDIK